MNYHWYIAVDGIDGLRVVGSLEGLFVTDGLAVRLGTDGLRVGSIVGLFITDGLGVRLGSDGLRVGFIEGGSR